MQRSRVLPNIGRYYYKNLWALLNSFVVVKIKYDVLIILINTTYSLSDYTAINTIFK